MINYTKMELVRTAGLITQIPRGGVPQIALSGRSNVGKSSFLNRIAGRKSLARVSGSPGKTITLNFYLADKRLYIVDLPGYGFAKRDPLDREKWSRLTDGYLTGGQVSGVAQFIDLKVGPTADDEMMLDFLGQTDIPFIVVATKTDKLNTTARNESLAALKEHSLINGAKVIPFSALSGEGVDECRAALSALAK